jgi:cell division protease FtsH
VKWSKVSIWHVLLLLAALWMFLQWRSETNWVPIAYSEFKELLDAGAVQTVTVSPQIIQGTFKADRAKPLLSAESQKLIRAGDVDIPFQTVRIEDPSLVAELQSAAVQYWGDSGTNWFSVLLSWVVPAVAFGLIWMFVFGRLGPKGAGDLMSIGKSKARVYVQKNIDVRFSDVEGIDEAKAELMQVVEFLKSPERYTRLGGRIPKGVLIVGAPGTGKTLLAKAVAGEAEVPFLSISGSEFVEMFVGVGAARVRDLFEQASQSAPCIIFIDELDALGRARGVNGVTTHEEREQTLNQLLVEMDGFDTNRGVIIMAATNRPEILDPALLRPGRFDRQVAIDRPDIHGRERILRLHAKRLVLAPDVDMSVIAGKTPGFAGADLANVVNEAALHAAQMNKAAVAMSDFDAAIERSIAGLEKKTRIMNQSEKKTVAVHEAGHALIAELRATTDKVSKVSIIPRGFGALGFTQQLPTEDRYVMKYAELLDRLDVLLGGRGAERVIFGEMSTGATDDLQRATDLAQHMIAQYGMSGSLGAAVFEVRSGTAYLGDTRALMRREYSEQTARRIDDEIRQLLFDSEARVHQTLLSHRCELEAVADQLLVRETLDRADFLVILRSLKDAPREERALPVAVTST